jgi:hypothetical protein
MWSRMAVATAILLPWIEDLMMKTIRGLVAKREDDLSLKIIRWEHTEMDWQRRYPDLLNLRNPCATLFDINILWEHSLDRTGVEWTTFCSLMLVSHASFC